MVAADGFSKPPSKPKTPALKQKPPTFTSAFTSSIDHPTPSKATALRTPLRTLKPLAPTFAAPQSVNDDARRQLRPAPPPVLHIPHDTPTVTLKHRPPPLLNLQASTSNILLKSLPPPMPIETTPIRKPPSKVLKPLIPPILPELQHTPASATNKEMRTISTTHIARATDISTDSGVSELASIFLHDQHPDILLLNEPGASVHHMRGLDLSPEKKGKGRAKFIRNGLAARASNLFDRSHTSLILWQKELEKHPSTMSSPDLRMRIVKILHKPLPPRGKSTTSSPGIALCQLLSSATKTPKLDELQRVLFSFSATSTHGSVRDPDQFVEGRVVHIWAPWHEITAPQPDILPASLPLPSSDPFCTPNPLDLPVTDKTLLCSRFLIVTP